MFFRAYAKLINSVGIGEPDKFDLLEHEQHCIHNAVLRRDNSELLHPVRADKIDSRTLNPNYDLFLVLGVKATRVEFFEAVEKCAVSLQHQDLILDLGWHCHSHIADIFTFVKEKQMGAQIRQKILIQSVVLQLDALSHLTEGFLIGRPFKIVWVESFQSF